MDEIPPSGAPEDFSAGISMLFHRRRVGESAGITPDHAPDTWSLFRDFFRREALWTMLRLIVGEDSPGMAVFVKALALEERIPSEIYPGICNKLGNG